MEWYLWVLVIVLVFLFFLGIISKGISQMSGTDIFDDTPIKKIQFKNPLTGEVLIFETLRFNRDMDWSAADKACNLLGNGWRLPSIYEFELLTGEESNWSWCMNYSGYFWSSTLCNESDFVFIARIPPKDGVGCTTRSELRMLHSVIAIRKI
jgi:hypothetical protein